MKCVATSADLTHKYSFVCSTEIVQKPEGGSSSFPGLYTVCCGSKQQLAMWHKGHCSAGSSSSS